MTSQGTVVACGSDDDNQYYGISKKCQDYKIVAIYASSDNSCALAEDGTLVIVGADRRNGYNNSVLKKNVWNDIVEVNLDCGVGLTKEGKVVSFYENKNLEKEISNWSDIISITGYTKNSLAGLKADGTVVHYQEIVIDEDRFDTSNWSNIIAISADRGMLVGLKSNGTVVATGDKNEKFSFNKLKLFNDYSTYEEEKKEAIKKRIAIEEERRRLIENRRQQNLCQHCGGTFKGLFTKKCSSCGKEKDY